MGLFSGKRLLLLGTSVASVSMVRYAQQEGAYVIVTDNLTPEQSAAKQICDECADVSTHDMDALYEFALKKDIDGIFCGVSEGNLRVLRSLCEKLGLPCYFTQAQWDVCQNKKTFKKLCIKYGVPVPREYTVADGKNSVDNAEFPVIVKPVDGFAARGITICRTERELAPALRYAREHSGNGSIIVEDYVTGTEITSVYTIKNGEVSLSILRDRYPSLDHPGVTAQFDASIAPSQFYKQYMEQVNPAVIKMLKGIGAYAGTVFFQGIATEKKIYIFECGYRIPALCDYYYLEPVNGINYMKMAIEYALTGKSDHGDLSRDNPNPRQFCCVFNMTAHAGTIGSLHGLEEVQKIPGVYYAEFLLPLGYKIKEDNSMAQSVFRAYIATGTYDELKNIIKKIQDFICVLDVDGKDMLFLKFDVERIVNSLNN
jgi:biotin carboxylase